MKDRFFLSYGGNAIATTGKQFTKDILKIGEWFLDTGTWNVTADVLKSIKDSFDSFKSNGGKVPLVWDHSNSSKDTIGWVDQVWIENDTLRASITVTDKAAQEKIPATIQEVSVGVYEQFKDGLGNLYDYFLYHLGAVVMPVIPDQGPFTELQILPQKKLNQTLNRKEVIMAEDTNPVDNAVDQPVDNTPVETPAPEAPKEISYKIKAEDNTIAYIVGLINKAFAMDATHLHLPENTTAANLVERLEMLVDQSKPADPVMDMPSDLPAEVADQLSKLQSLCKTQAEQIKHMNLKVEAEKKTAFVNGVENLIKKGSILPVHKANLVSAGELAKWDLSLVKALEDCSTYAGGSKTKAIQNIEQKKSELSLNDFRKFCGLKV